MSRRLAEVGHQVCAVDINMHPADGLPVARVYFARLPVHFARVEGEMANLPLADAQFDAVIANASLHYATLSHPHPLPGRGEGEVEALHPSPLPRRGEGVLLAALREAARVLRPGGVLVTLDSPFYSSAAAGEQMLTELKVAYAHHRLPAGAAGGFFTYDRFAGALAAAGLGRIEWRGSWRRGWQKTPLSSPGERVGMREWRRLTNLLHRGQREQASFPIIFAYKENGV